MALLLATPSLDLGLRNDDQILRMALGRQAPGVISRGPFDLFAFYPQDPAATRRLVDLGVAPWWTPPDFRIAFFRPLAGLTHWLDFRLWPDHPWLMHAQSIAWFIALVAIAALLYRRLLGATWVAGLAALLFAIDDGHGMPAMWIANRNAIIATVFAFLALGAHHRWRSEGWRPGMVLAPAFLAAGLLGGETALGICAFLFAYAMFLDRGPLARRLLTLAPAAIVVIAWSATYRLLGFGVTESAMYVDPGASPAAFGRAVVERAPLLLFGQFGLPSGIHIALSVAARHAMWTTACAYALVMAVLFTPLVVRDRLARFFAVGVLLALLPACGTFADDRTLLVAGFGGMGLLAQFLAGMWTRDWRLSRARLWRGLAWAALPVLLVIHFLLAPLSFVGARNNITALSVLLERAGRSLPADPAVVNQRVIVVNTPSAYVSEIGLVWPRLDGRPMPARLLIAGAGIYPTHIARPTARSIVIHPEGGFLAPAGSPQPGHERDQPAFDWRYLLMIFDGLYRASPMAVGDTIALSGITIRVDAITADGRPDTVTYEFADDPEGGAFRWLQWQNGVYVPFHLPALGQSVTLPAVEVPFGL